MSRGIETDHRPENITMTLRQDNVAWQNMLQFTFKQTNKHSLHKKNEAYFLAH